MFRANPKHLPILHDELAAKIAKLVIDLEGLKPNKVFIDYNPGFGLIARKLIEQLNSKQDKFILIESFNKFIPVLNEFKINIYQMISI